MPPAFAQGTILFANLKGLDARVTDCNQVPLSGSQFMAGLFAGPSADSLAFVGAVPFFSGTYSGYFSGGSISIPGVPVGSTAMVQVAVWNTSAGATFFDALAAGAAGASPVLSIVTTYPPAPPAALVGLIPSDYWPGFCPYAPPVPPPRLFVDRTETNTLVCSWPFSAELFAVQESFDLTNWNTLVRLPSFEGTRNRIIIPAPAHTAFYRLVSTR
jgi:hypothetical protein